MPETGEKKPKKVRILSEDVINRIAAGEVIERPSSIVKELVENSIDAGSGTISVWIKEGGKSLIRITDDGEGMSEEDAVLAVERHATSKIRTAQDLEAIYQLGFRGEALSSIAAVSLMEIKSGIKGDEAGTSVRIEAGRIEEVRQTAWETGTSISVRNLFYNTPGRRKFLRAANTEMRHIVKIFKQFALGYPEISFSLYHNDQPLWNLAASSIGERLKEVFSESFFELLIDMENRSSNGFGISGFIAKPELIKSWSSDQYLYLNRRSIINRTVRSALMSAYGTTIERGTSPFYLLNIAIEPETVDVNVHPSKWEVRFQNESDIYKAVYSAVRERLSGSGISIPEFSRRGASFGGAASDAPAGLSGQFQPVNDFKVFEAGAQQQDSGQLLFSDASSYEEKKDESGFEARGSFRAGVDPGKLWQMHNKYIICQVKTGIAIIDQHAAHERILFEKTKEILETKGGVSQHLVFPEVFEINSDELVIINDIIPHLNKIGFSIKLFSKNSIVVEAVPGSLKSGMEKGFLRQFLDTYKEDEMRELDIYDRVASSFACHAAIRTGDSLSFEEMNALIDELFATKFPYYCPHGRPIIIHMTLEELDKRFHRIR